MEKTNRANQVWTLVLTSIAAFMISLDSLVVAAALNTIRLDLGASIETLEWTVNAYALAFAVFLMTGAAFGDRLGRKKVFLAGLAIFTLASIACALAPDAAWLIAARTVQGIGAALVMPLSLSLLSAAFPPEKRAKALGISSGIVGLAVVSGPVLGGAITQGLAWEWIFWINIPIGIVLAPLVIKRIQESTGKGLNIDLTGLAFITAGLFGLVWGLIRANTLGWAHAEVTGALAVGLLLMAGFVWWERKTKEPMIPLTLFRSRAFTFGNLAAFFLFATLYSAVFFIAQFMQVSLGYGPLDTGIRVLPWTATLFIIAPLAGALVNKVGERVLVVAGLMLQAIGLGWIALIAQPGMAYEAMILPLILAGAGISLAIPATQHAVIAAVDKTEIGKASGVFNMLRQLGGAFGIAILATIFASVGSFASGEAFASGFAPAIAWCAGLSLAGALAALFLRRRQLEQ